MDTQTRAWRKSSRSNSQGCCLEAASFIVFSPRTSSFCSTGGCVETGTGRKDGHHVVAVRDNTLEDSPVLAFGPGAWQMFTGRIKASTEPAIVC